MFPNNKQFLLGAQKIWDWFFSFDNGYGLMSDEYIVSTGAVPEYCCNATSDVYSRCTNTRIYGTSYNQGLLLSSSAYLYTQTGIKSYLGIGMRALNAILTNYTTKDGLLRDEQRGFQSYSYQCRNGEDPGGDYYSFNGIFILHLGYFTEVLTKNKSLSPSTLSEITCFIVKMSNSAWLKSAVWPPFDIDDKCSINTMKSNGSYPKFHWWWGHNVTNQVVLPPDIRQFYLKQRLRCVGQDTQLWEGLVGSEGKCREKCVKNSSCSKYLYQRNDQGAGPQTNCWIWSYNRSDHSCHQSDYNYNVGIKRPIGSASCAGQCGSSKPLTLHEGVCYCDPDCVKHLDCCLDYADYCLPSEPITCRGLCNQQDLYSRAVPGGGYCWCDVNCNRWSTDNNSDSSCCPDFMQVCEQVPPPLCLDARSQGSALNLFLTHFNVVNLSS